MTVGSSSGYGGYGGRHHYVGKNFENWRQNKDETSPPPHVQEHYSRRSSSSLIDPSTRRLPIIPFESRSSLVPMRTYYAFGARHGVTSRPLNALMPSASMALRPEYRSKPAPLTAAHVLIDSLHEDVDTHLLPHHTEFSNAAAMLRRTHRPIVYPADSIRKVPTAQSLVAETAAKLELQQLAGRVRTLEADKASLKEKIAHMESDQIQKTRPGASVPGSDRMAARIKQLELEVSKLKKQLQEVTDQLRTWKEKALTAESEAKKWKTQYDNVVRASGINPGSLPRLPGKDEDIISLNAIRQTITNDMKVLQSQMEDALRELE